MLFLAPMEWLGADRLNHDKTPNAHWFTVSLGGWYLRILTLRLSARGAARGGTRCSFVLEHMVSLHPHSTCASTTAQRGSAHTPQESGIDIKLLNYKVDSVCLCLYTGSVCVRQRDRDRRPCPSIFTFRCTTQVSNMWYQASTADVWRGFSKV